MSTSGWKTTTTTTKEDGMDRKQKQAHTNGSRTVNDRHARNDDEEAFQYREDLDLTNDFKVKFGLGR